MATDHTDTKELGGGWPLDRHIHQVAEQISCLTRAVRDFTDEFKCSRSHSNLVTKDDLKEMEKRLIHSIGEKASITPAVEAAAMSVQSALDKLDASIPDKK